MKIRFILILFYITALTSSIFSQTERIELLNLEFEGNTQIPTSKLETVISHNESSWWFIRTAPDDDFSGIKGLFLNILSFGVEEQYLDTLRIVNDISLLKKYYWSEGFFEVDIKSEYSFQTENSEGELKFIISENEPFVIKKLNIGGFEKLSKSLFEAVKNQLTIDTNNQYSERLVQENNDIIMNYLGDRGRMFVSSEDPNIVIDTALNKVDVNLKFDVGDSFSISDVQVERTGSGKELVEDNLLTDIVGIEKGDRFSFYEMQRGQVRLYRTNLFSSASVSAVRADTSNGTVPILISAEVGSLYEFSPELILNDQEGFNLGLGLGFTRKNFLGDARKLSLNFSIASQNPWKFLQEISASNSNLYGYADARLVLEQPFLFGKAINTRFESYFTHQIRKDFWDANLIGTKISLDFELPRYTYITSLRVFLNWENSEYMYSDNYIDQVLSDTTLIYNEELKDEINTNPQSNYVLLGVNIGVNKTNDFLFPTRGYNLNFIFEDGNLLHYLASEAFNSTMNRPVYYKTLMKSAYYFPFQFISDGVLGLKLISGYIHTYRGRKDLIPFNQRFTAGGSNSVRGWETRGLTPSRQFIDYENLSKEDFDALFNQQLTPGGFFIIEGSFETRYKLSDEFGSAIFVDYGNTWNDPDEFRFNEFAVAAGFGFRYYSPFAPIRVDFGFKVYDPSDRRSFFKKNVWNEFEFQLGIGEAF
ncbi:MAG: BamA/TamA family outer membrane protein [Melioribacteraceae bacterium]|nr:BamA/TamA family outer membrane protein [Melioribacteraceae bacterium]